MITIAHENREITPWTIKVVSFNSKAEALDYLVNVLEVYLPDDDYEPDENYDEDFDTVIEYLVNDYYNDFEGTGDAIMITILEDGNQLVCI